MLNIKKMRRDAGMTQRELGHKVGVSFQAISQYETGTAEPRVETLRKIADVFGCTVDELLRGEA